MLTDQDKSDLLGLVSGLGDSASDERGRELSARSEEAAQFLEQVRALAGSFLPPADDENASLSLAQVDRISHGAYTRWRHRRLRNILAPLALAACIALLGFGVQRVFRSVLNASSPTAMVFTLESNQRGNERFWIKAFVPGQPFTTSKEEFALIHVGNARAVLSKQSTAVFSNSDVELKSGEMVIESKGKLDFQADPVHGELSSGKALVRCSPESTWVMVFEGHVQAEIAGHSVALNAGQEGIWGKDGQVIRLGQKFEPFPDYPLEAFERDELRPR